MPGGGKEAQGGVSRVCRGRLAGIFAQKTIAAIFLIAVPLTAAEPSTKSRAVDYTEGGDIPHLYIQKGYETEVRIDKAESIVAATTGLADFQPTFVGHIAVLKFLGTNTGQKTDLRILCASGNEYSFIVEEVSKRRDVQADLNVYVKSEDDDAKRAMLAPPKLFTADQVAAIQAREKEAQEALQREQNQRKSDASKAALNEAHSIRHDYKWKHNKAADAMGVVAIWHDARFSYIQTNTQEAPSIYELKDGKESLVQFTLTGGLYTIPKILDAGVLRVGKEKLEFRREKEQG